MLAKLPAHRIEVSTMDKPDRRRLRLAGACKNRMHITPQYRAKRSIGGHTGYGKKSCANKASLQVNQSLGLTFYCSDMPFTTRDQAEIMQLPERSRHDRHRKPPDCRRHIAEWRHSRRDRQRLRHDQSAGA